MTKVSIRADLERRLRSAVNSKKEGEWHGESLIREIIELLDDAQGKREAGAAVSEVQTGLGYKALVSLFRSYLGDSLLTPPKPSTPYIVKIVNKAKEQGIDSTNVEQIVKGFRRLGDAKGAARLIELVYNADKYYAAGGERGEHGGPDNEVDEGFAGDKAAEGDQKRVHIGRY